MKFGVEGRFVAHRTLARVSGALTSLNLKLSPANSSTISSRILREDPPVRFAINSTRACLKVSFNIFLDS
jgi:hypothetical protein